MSTNSEGNQVIQEYVDSRGEALRVERQAGTLRGVKLLGVASRNGRSYPDKTLRQAVALYEGAKVNVNHPKGDPLSPRDYQDRIGVIRDVEFRPASGLFGVLHFNPGHPLAEQLLWDAENAPENVGLSHNVLARTSQQDGGVVVEEITKVQSVDLVADPATTRGLFEQQSRDGESRAAARGSFKASDSCGHLTIELLESQRPDLIEAIASPLRQELAACKLELDCLQVREAAFKRRTQVERSLVEHGLPVPVAGDASTGRLISRDFLSQLLEASSDDDVDRLVKDRAEALAEARSWRPTLSPATCREQVPSGDRVSEAITSSADFVAAITCY